MKKTKFMKAFGLAVNIKSGWYLDKDEIFLLKRDAADRAKILGFGHRVVKLTINYEIPI